MTKSSKWLFSAKNFYALLTLPVHVTCPANLSLFDSITLTIIADYETQYNEN
jgi:hypothetical protein